ALADFDRAVALDAGNAQIWNDRGQALTAASRHLEALASYDRTLTLMPGHTQGRNNRGLALEALGRGSEALAEFDHVLALKPDHAGAWVNRGGVLRSQDRIDEALSSYDRALAIDPDLPQALSSRANLLWTRRGALNASIADLERLVKIAPDYPYAAGDLLHLKMHAGDWTDFARSLAVLDEGVREGRRIVDPYAYQALSNSPADLLSCARIYCDDRYPQQPAVFTAQARQAGRIRIGYVCGEFRDQATMILAAGLFEHHDRARFEVIGFDNSRDDASAMRARVISAFDEFVPIQSLSDQDAAALIAARKIDILVNLNGYFGALRMGVFAHHPATIQVNYLGFPGTLGAGYIDYILADAEVIRADEHRYFSAKVALLPQSYQINDDKRALAAATTRAEHGLSERDFVFCNFNYGYKILPGMFAAWMRLLARVPGSVLWLLDSNPLFVGNLKAEAARHGIDPARLVFAPRLEPRAHLSRLALGDLFVDSLPYNAHTTASDALWAGLPLVTCRGKAFPGRVAASLLGAVGLGELVTEDLDSYEALAV
ncbi:MAG: tetratricopeptide repeat protein, partial [Rhizomicrobium sp.]